MKIILENIEYRRNHQIILKNINLIMESNYYSIIGPNGSGKTTLLQIVSGTEWPSSGKAILLKNNELYYTGHKKKIFSYFLPKLSSWIDSFHPNISVLETICSGYFNEIGYYTEASSTQKEYASILVNKFIPSISLEYLEKKFIHLSTGEKYRTLLLRSIIRKPEILILDEPFDGLDLKGRLDFEKLIKEVSKEIPFIIFVLHRIEEIPDFIKKVILLKQGSVFQYGNIDNILTSENFSELYEIPIEIKKLENRYYAIIRANRY